MPTLRILLLIAFAVAGAVAGWAYFAIMRVAVRRAIKDKSLGPTFVILLLVRVVIFLGGAAAAWWIDAVCVVPYLIAFLVARTFVLRGTRAEMPTSAEEKTR
jgi:NhaP-type Na+/H+ or K+/H+ antiporter